jgi:hypothetical protein
MARKPTKEEVKVLRTLLDGRLKSYRQDRSGALKLLSVGESALSPKLEIAELAAYTTVASVIFNLDETITKQ